MPDNVIGYNAKPLPKAFVTKKKPRAKVYNTTPDEFDKFKQRDKDMKKIPRGGYASAGGRRPPRRPSAPKAPVSINKNFGLGDAMGYVAKYYAGKAISAGYPIVAKFTSEMMDAATKEIGIRSRYELKRILNPPGLTGRPDRTVPCLTENVVSAVKNIGTIEPKLSHKTKLTTGNPSSKTLLEMAKENGVETRTLFDSKMWGPSTQEAPLGDIINRQVLSHSCGFNCRNFAVLGNLAYVTQRNFVEVAFPLVEGGTTYDVGTGVTSSLSDGRTYASVLETIAEIQLHNQSRFLPIELTVHVVCRSSNYFIIDNSEPSINIANELVKLIGEDDMGNIRSPQRDGIPGWYLVGDKRVEADGYQSEFTSWNMLNSGKGLTSSPHFRDNYTIVESKTKTLEPNDSWQFRHEHQFGGGVDVDVIVGNYVQGTSTANNTPLSYFYIIESKGLPCEGVYVAPGPVKEPRFGTSPGYYFIELRKSIKFVRPAESSRDLIPGLQTLGGPREKRIHTRTFTKNENDWVGVNERKPFYRLPEEVGVSINSTSGNTVGSFWIPIEAETTRTRAGAQTKSDGADNDPVTR